MSEAERPSRPHAAAALLLLAGLAPACSCEDPQVSTLAPLLDATRVVDLGEVPVGVRARGPLTISNLGTAVLDLASFTLTASTAAGFTVSSSVAPPTALPPAGSLALTIEARPSAIGLFTTELTIRSDDTARDPFVVVVRVRGVARPPCDDGNACTEDWFDVDLADCRHRFADGAPCEPRDRCVVDATCSQGVCLGRSKVCQDDSVCTRDLCRQVDGECLFLSAPDVCEDDNPCTADRCGPEGCAHEPVANGTGCDDGDACTRGDACFQGVCRGSGALDGEACDDRDSCTTDDRCAAGRCRGRSILDGVPEGQTVFTFPLADWPQAFLHRREVSMGDDGVHYSMDHRPVPGGGLIHVIDAFRQCGTVKYEFSYQPPTSHVFVSYVRREMQVQPDGTLRIVVGIRQRPEVGFLPQTTSYVLDPAGTIRASVVDAPGGETGRSLLPDGSNIYGVIYPLNRGPIENRADARQNLVVVREDRDGNVLWRHERSTGEWAEFLGTAGPRVLFWANQRWGALDFNTGDPVWESATPYIADQMALSTQLNLGLARVESVDDFGFRVPAQLVGVELLEGRQVFVFPAVKTPAYVPRTDPVISADGRIILLMQRGEPDPNTGGYRATGLDFVELAPDGTVLTTTALPYVFPEGGLPETRSRDFGDDSFPTVADDGITYVGYGDHFWAIEPGGNVRWTITSSLADAFTATVPVLREDGVLLINESSRRLIGVRTNGGRMSAAGWASFRHDSRRTNHTP
jgi:outer membrane protein assembly factor BamB